MSSFVSGVPNVSNAHTSMSSILLNQIIYLPVRRGEPSGVLQSPENLSHPFWCLWTWAFDTIDHSVLLILSSTSIFAHEATVQSQPGSYHTFTQNWKCMQVSSIRDPSFITNLSLWHVTSAHQSCSLVPVISDCQNITNHRISNTLLFHLSIAISFSVPPSSELARITTNHYRVMTASYIMILPSSESIGISHILLFESILFELKLVFPEFELINLIINYIKLSLPMKVDPSRLPDFFSSSKLEFSYRVFLRASGGIVTNFFCWRRLCQIWHLLNLRNLYYKRSEFRIFLATCKLWRWLQNLRWWVRERRTLEQISFDDISCRLKVAGTQSWFLFLDTVRVDLSPSPPSKKGSVPGPVRVDLSPIHLLILICRGSDYVPDVTIAVWVKEHIAEARILGNPDFWFPHLSPVSGLGDRRDLILCLSEFRRLVRVKPCPAVEKLRLADGRSLRKNPRPLPGLSDYGYPDYWNPHLSLSVLQTVLPSGILFCAQVSSGAWHGWNRVQPLKSLGWQMVDSHGVLSWTRTFLKPQTDTGSFLSFFRERVPSHQTILFPCSDSGNLSRPQSTVPVPRSSSRIQFQIQFPGSSSSSRIQFQF